MVPYYQPDPPWTRRAARLHGVHQLQQHGLQLVDATSHRPRVDVDGRHGYRLLDTKQVARFGNVF